MIIAIISLSLVALVSLGLFLRAVFVLGQTIRLNSLLIKKLMIEQEITQQLYEKVHYD